MTYYNEVVTGEENTRRLMKGLEIMESTVGSTLGPCGTNVILQTEFGVPHITKDGVSVAKAIKLKDVEGIGAALLKEVSSKSEKVGDGTTSSVVIAYEIAKQGLKHSTMFNPFGLKRGIEEACKQVIDKLKEVTTPVKTSDDIYNVALVSTNHDEMLASLFKKSYELAGKDGTIVVEQTKDTETTCEKVAGLQFDRGFVHASFINDEERQECKFENPNILLYDGVLDNLVDLSTFFQNLGSILYEKPLVVVAEKFDENVLTTFVVNRVKNGARVLLVKAPGMGDRRKEWLDDLAAFTGATCVSADTGVSLSTMNSTHFGSCDIWTSDFDKSTILRGHSNPEKLSKQKDTLKGLAERAITDIDKTRHLERLARISNGVVSIKIGGATDVEVKELADRVDDALHAVKEAADGGFCCGGGTTLIGCSLNCVSPFDTTSAEHAGFNLFIEACKCTLRKIAVNVGKTEFSPDFVVAQVVNEIKKGNPTYGFDAKEGRFVPNMIEAGIIDPTNVVASSIRNAVSVATLLLSSGSTVIRVNEKQEDAS